MAYRNEILLGRITKVSGYEGAVTVKLERFFSEKLPHMKSVFLEIEGRPVPFFIATSEYSGADILKLQFEGYESSEKVNEFIGCRVFLTTGAPTGKKIENALSFSGFSVITTDNIVLGIVDEVIQNPGQWLLSVVNDAHKTILIPLHENFIVKIDKKNKLLQMDLPEGLTEIN
jgi:16S rRNA processing protein RimM